MAQTSIQIGMLILNGVLFILAVGVLIVFIKVLYKLNRALDIWHGNNKESDKGQS